MKLLNTLFFLLLLSFGSTAQSAQTLFEEGNQLYNTLQYDEAIEKYEAALKTNQESSAIYYNLGNAYFKKNQVAKAILYYEKALLLNPNDADIKQNLLIAQEGTIDRFDVMPKPLIKQIYLGLLHLCNTNTWAWLSLIMFIISILGLGFYLYTSIKKLGFILIVVGLIIGSTTLAFAFASNSYNNNHKGAIIMAASSYVKSAPSASAEDVFILHQGTKAIIVDELNIWSKIQLPDGKVGWIHTADLSAI